VRRSRPFALAAALVVAGAAGAAAAQSVAESDYALQCRGCHGPEGAGVPGLVPNLGEMGTMLATPEGRARLLRVPGIRQASLSDARLAALLNWAAVRFGEGEDGVRPIAPEEVSQLRSRAQRGTSQMLR
jgi:mono/diheme cytochrome c family protein